MSEPAWTKGPWQRSGVRMNEPKFKGHPVGPDRDPVVIVPYNDKNHSECMANAHLIASAPTLYQELAEMVEIFHGYQGMELTRAKAALAKARGETS